MSLGHLQQVCAPIGEVDRVGDHFLDSVKDHDCIETKISDYEHNCNTHRFFKTL